MSHLNSWARDGWDKSPKSGFPQAWTIYLYSKQNTISYKEGRLTSLKMKSKANFLYQKYLF